MNTNELDTAVFELPYPRYGQEYNGKKIITTDDFVEARAVYNIEKDKLEVEWQQWLYEAYASDMNKQVGNAIYSKAWEDGHLAGYFDVETRYIGLAWFARTVLNHAL